MNTRAQHAKLLRQLGAQSPHALEEMYDAAAQALESLQKLAARGLNPVTAALDGAHDVVEWAHYPEGDARDDAARTRYYYHVHDAEDLGENEHGHFHVFVEPSPEEGEVPPTHVVGIAMDATGRLLRLFTTNQWVTGETWRAADLFSDSVDHFDISSGPSRCDLDRWIVSMVRLFRAQIGRAPARPRCSAAWFARQQAGRAE